MRVFKVNGSANESSMRRNVAVFFLATTLLCSLSAAAVAETPGTAAQQTPIPAPPVYADNDDVHSHPELVGKTIPMPLLPTEGDVIEGLGVEPLSPDNLLAYGARMAAQAGDDMALLMKAGIAYEMANQPGKALSLYERVLVRDPNRDELYRRMQSVVPEAINVYALGKKVQFPDANPMLVNSRTLVPIRAISEALGAKISWYIDADKKVHATFVVNGVDVQLTEDSTEAVVGGHPVDLDVPAMIVPPGRFVVPLRFVSEQLGYKVDWFSMALGHHLISIRAGGQ